MDLVGSAEVAERLGVKVGTVYMWRHREVIPDPDMMISGSPTWNWDTVREWAIETGRLVVDQPDAPEPSANEAPPEEAARSADIEPVLALVEGDGGITGVRSMDPRLGVLLDQAPSRPRGEFVDACIAALTDGVSDERLNEVVAEILASEPPAVQIITQGIKEKA